MIKEFKTSILRITKSDAKVTFEAIAKEKSDQQNGSCQVGGSSDDPENPYCISDGCDNCVLHSKDVGNGVTEYWCSCES